MAIHDDLTAFADALLPLLPLTPDGNAIVVSASNLTTDDQKACLATSSIPHEKAFSVQSDGTAETLKFTLKSAIPLSSALDAALNQLSDEAIITLNKETSNVSCATYIPSRHEDDMGGRFLISATLKTRDADATSVEISIEPKNLTRFQEAMAEALNAQQANRSERLKLSLTNEFKENSQAELTKKLKTSAKEFEATLNEWLTQVPENDGLPASIGTRAALSASLANGVNEALQFSIPEIALSKFGAKESFTAHAANLEDRIKQMADPLLAFAASNGIDTAAIYEEINSSLATAASTLAADIKPSVGIFSQEIASIGKIKQR